jgi:hypothetical protein
MDAQYLDNLLTDSKKRALARKQRKEALRRELAEVTAKYEADLFLVDFEARLEAAIVGGKDYCLVFEIGASELGNGLSSCWEKLRQSSNEQVVDSFPNEQREIVRKIQKSYPLKVLIRPLITEITSPLDSTLENEGAYVRVTVELEGS